MLHLLTRDISTIGPMFVDWGMAGREHAGDIFVDDRTIAERDVRGLIRAVIQLWDKERGADWSNRVEFLRRQRGR